MTADKLLEISQWVERPTNLYPPLAGQQKADVVIIGGGYTGLTTALALREQGVDVALIEKDFCGMGASGRNAGHLTPTIGKDFPTLVKSVGETRAAEYARFADRAVRHTEARIRTMGIECEYVPCGNIITGLHARHRKPLESGAALGSRLGVEVEFIDEAEVRRRRLPSHVKFGVVEKAGGHLHSGKYVMALRRAAAEAGVRIFEQSSAVKIDTAGTRAEVHTDAGTLFADKLVLATNAYTTATLGLMKSRIYPLRVTLFRTQVLTDAQWERIGWTAREGLYTAHEAMENYRPQGDGRISGGSKFVQYGFGSSMTKGNLPDVFRQWHEIFARRFPELPDVKIEAFWGGWIGMTLDFLPRFETSRNGRMISGLGYNGHGIAQASYAGTMLADLVLERSNPEVELFSRRVFPLPPEPFRWAGINSVLRLGSRTDRKVDADLENGGG